MEFDSDDVVLSDVHLNKITDPGHPIFTRFEFKLQHNATNDAPSDVNLLELDEDGDMVVRRCIESCDVIVIKHEMSTALNNVGLQVWRGALLMCDYINFHTDNFVGKTVLELGCGTGLTSIFVGQVATSVVATDHGHHILELCKENVQENQRFISSRMHVTELNWFEELPLTLAPPQVILACDCIYDDDVTDALFQTIHNVIMKAKTASQTFTKKDCLFLVTYFSLEKRLNFTVEDLDVSCKEYTHFKKCLDNLANNEDSDLKYIVQHLHSDEIPLCFKYERVPQLELWILEAYFL